MPASHKNRVAHFYGPQVHLLQNTYLSSLLAKLCSPETYQPQINHLVEILYANLLTEVMNEQFPSENAVTDTRMTEYHPEQKLRYSRIKAAQKVISVNLARAGTFPSHVCYQTLHDVIEAKYLRQDHIFAARATAENGGHVIATQLGATKIGGDKQDSIVLFPDPMGATGTTLVTTMDYYKQQVAGTELKMIAIHLIVTPEYLKKVLTHHPDVVIYAVRLDRGLSPEAVLKTPPGQMWDQERGLNDLDYIVPGGGGFGEIMNNSFV